MSGFVVNGVAEDVPGIRCRSWLDNPVLRLNGEDKRVRKTTWIRGITLHTTKGIPGGSDHRPQVIIPGLSDPTNDGERTARYWSTDGRNAGAHIVVDRDGDVACVADLEREVAYHAGLANEVGIGIEIYQGSDAELYDGQLDVVVRVVDYLTKRFGIQRQLQWPYHGGSISRLASGAIDVVGIYGHRDVSSNRGSGDPGDAVMRKLVLAGYEQVDFASGTDLLRWRSRQANLSLTLGTPVTADGVPGQKTVLALKKAGYAVGLWIPRPGDVTGFPPIVS